MHAFPKPRIPSRCLKPPPACKVAEVRQTESSFSHNSPNLPETETGARRSDHRQAPSPHSRWAMLIHSQLSFDHSAASINSACWRAATPRRRTSSSNRRRRYLPRGFSGTVTSLKAPSAAARRASRNPRPASLTGR